MFKHTLKIMLPLLILVGSCLGAYQFVLRAESPKPRPPELYTPEVMVTPAEFQSVRLDVESYGSVQARTEVVLAPQVPGKVEKISPNLKKGAFFKKHEVLVTLEARDYELAVTSAQAVVAQAQAALDREAAEAEIAKAEWEEYGQGDPDPLALRQPQLKEAKARLNSAKAQLEQAELNLSRTRIKAPCNGRVIQESIDQGQYLVAGGPIATIHGIDYVEVRLEIPNDQLDFLNLPLNGNHHCSSPIEVELRAAHGFDEALWSGALVRTEAEVDKRTRVLGALVRVENPYKQDPPLLIGTYVRAVIPGKEMERAAVLPRKLLRDNNQVYVIDPDNRLRIRRVEILKKEKHRVILKSGVSENDLICITDIHPAVDGMQVRLAMETASKE